jgi:cytochrome c oxidase cbb3-type subunit 2
MPGFPWLADNAIDGDEIAARLRALRKIGVPYSDADIAAAPAAVTGKTEMDAVIAYMQSLKFRGDSTRDQASTRGQP